MTTLGVLQKSLNKKGYNTTLSEPDKWVSWGNMAMNYMATGSFVRGIPNSRLCMLYGLSGSGKSLVLGHAIKNIQQEGYKIIFVDTEDAIDQQFLTKIGVDVEDEQTFLPLRTHTIEDTSEAVSEIFRTFDKDEKIAVFVDSLGMLETEDHAEQFEKSGDLKADMGLDAKKTKKLLKNINSKVGERDMFFIVNTHAYQNQTPTDGRGPIVVSGGQVQVFIPSITFRLQQLNLKEDTKQGKKQTGIRMKVYTEKTRFHQKGMETEIQIPYKTGIDPYDGVLDILEEAEVVSKSGAWYSYEVDGEKKKFQKNSAHEHLDYLISILEEGYEIGESEDPYEEEQEKVQEEADELDVGK